tara:strand:- start:30 stop:272 length:243 start_codon:yes stop_codon:yes gene_type:complete
MKILEAKYVKDLDDSDEELKDREGNSYDPKQYVPSPTIGINVELSKGLRLSIPICDDNTDYVEVMRQVDAGELTIEPADE